MDATRRTRTAQLTMSRHSEHQREDARPAVDLYGRYKLAHFARAGANAPGPVDAPVDAVKRPWRLANSKGFSESKRGCPL